MRGPHLEARQLRLTEEWKKSNRFQAEQAVASCHTCRGTERREQPKPHSGAASEGNDRALRRSRGAGCANQQCTRGRGGPGKRRRGALRKRQCPRHAGQRAPAIVELQNSAEPRRRSRFDAMGLRPRSTRSSTESGTRALQSHLAAPAQEKADLDDRRARCWRSSSRNSRLPACSGKKPNKQPSWNWNNSRPHSDTAKQNWTPASNAWCEPTHAAAKIPTNCGNPLRLKRGNRRLSLTKCEPAHEREAFEAGTLARREEELACAVSRGFPLARWKMRTDSVRLCGAGKRAGFNGTDRGSATNWNAWPKCCSKRNCRSPGRPIALGQRRRRRGSDVLPEEEEADILPFIPTAWAA